MAERIYTAADVDLVDKHLWPRLVLEPDSLYRQMAQAVLDALVAAGWRPPSATGAVIHPTHAEQVAYDEGYAQGRTAAAEAIADALDEQLKHGAPAMSPAYHSGYRDAARYVRNRGAEAGRG
jgi:hypothetical protein